MTYARLIEYERLKLDYVEAVLADTDHRAMTDSDAVDRAERRLDAFVLAALRRRPHRQPGRERGDVSPRRMDRAPVTAETVRSAIVVRGEVQTVTEAGVRLLRSREELGGISAARWVERERVRRGIVEPWDWAVGWLEALDRDRAGREASGLVDYDDVA